MQNMNEFFLILGLAIFGVLFFTFLEKSLKVEKKFPKIVYLVFATMCGFIVMECIVRLTLGTEPFLDFLDKVLLILMRIMQGGFCLIGVLISISIALKPKTE
jgi:hypothetical protein